MAYKNNIILIQGAFSMKKTLLTLILLSLITCNLFADTVIGKNNKVTTLADSAKGAGSLATAMDFVSEEFEQNYEIKMFSKKDLLNLKSQNQVLFGDAVDTALQTNYTIIYVESNSDEKIFNGFDVFMLIRLDNGQFMGVNGKY